MKKIKELLKKIPDFRQLSRKKKVLSACIATALILVILVMAVVNANKTETVYRETTVQYGNLTVGITETGNVSVEETEQTFDVDISEYSADDTSYSWSSGNGGANPFQAMSQIMSNTTSSSTSTSTTRVLTVEEVYVSAGEEIKAGDPICRLSQESVESIRSALAEDEAEAFNTWNEKQTDAKVNTLSASQEMETNQTYGQYAKIQYDISVGKLTQAVTDAQESLDEAAETLEENKTELTEKQETLATQQKVLENAEYAKAGTDKNVSLYYWLQAENARDEAKSQVESLEEEIETLTDTIAQGENEILTLTANLNTAKKDLDTGKIEAQATYDINMLKYENSQDIYDTAIADASLKSEMAEDDYNTAKEKLDDFDTNIVDDNVVAASDGVISAVSVSAGDSIYSDSSIITYNSYEDVSVTITITEDEKNKIEEGTLANVTLSAFGDEVFQGEVSEIGDAVYDSDTGTNNYDITVNITGDLGKIYDGMSAEVTLITKEMKEVLYVPNRAITRENEKSYVKIKDANGNVKKVSVETGFSDGVNVEIVKGLSENDVVLVESKVTR